MSESLERGWKSHSLLDAGLEREQNWEFKGGYYKNP